MSKHEPITPPPAVEAPSPDLLRRVRDAYLAHRARHDGKNPTRAELNAVIHTSYTRLGPAARAVEAELDAIETKLSVMPEMPEELRLQHEQFLKDLWVRTREIGNSETTALRQVAEMREEKHRHELAETDRIIALIEAERDAERARAEAAEAALDELRATQSTTAADLLAAEARNEALREALALMGREAPRQTTPGTEPASSGKSVRRGRKRDEAAPSTSTSADAAETEAEILSRPAETPDLPLDPSA